MDDQLPAQAAHDSGDSREAGDSRIRIAVVFGGRSSEHAVSVVTAANVVAVLDDDRYDVVPIGITAEGAWVIDTSVTDRNAIESADSLPAVDTAGTPVLLGEQRQLLVCPPGQIPHQITDVDVVLPLLHGPFGEDGTLQGMLEMAGVRYVGSGVLASAAGMDKQFMKTLIGAAGIEQVPWVTITNQQWRRSERACLERVEALGFPVFVKPARGGSSIGISKVSEPAGLAAAIEAAREHDPKVVVEAGAHGAREIECGVLGSLRGEVPEVSVCAEISVVGSGHEFYDFEAKYLPEQGTEISVPADLDEQIVTTVQQMAVRAFEALGCEGLARVDFFVTDDGRVLLNEVNTMPGFTPTSVFPRVWQESGIDYADLVDRLVQLAVNRPVGLR